MNKLRSFLLASASFCCIVALGQKSITERTYWLDGDYASAATLDVSVDVSSLAAGLHSLTMRVQDSEGMWSSPVTKFFVIPSYAVGSTEIAERQYWLDGDYAHRTTLGASTAVVDLGELRTGLHSFTMRVRDDVEVWSSPVTKFFLIEAMPDVASLVAEREYWLDGKYAERSTLGTSVAIVDLSALNPGLHSYSMRVRDDVGVWSAPVTKYFIISTEESFATELAAREYWLDGNYAERTALGTSEAIVDLGELGSGMHSFTMRVKDDVGVWSSPVTQYFVVLPFDENQELTLTHYAYWFDDDNAQVQSGLLEAESGVIPVSITRLDEGRHALKWVVGDSRGKWSEVAVDSFNVEHVELVEGMISLAASSFEYQGEDIRPEVTVADGEDVLVQDEDYELLYADNLNAGEATLTVRGLGFYKESVTTRFTITPAQLTVRADDQVRDQGEENPELTFTIEGWKGTDDASVLITQPTATTEATAESPAGTYQIFVDGAEAHNYTFLYVPGTLTVNIPIGINAVAADREEGDWYTIGGQKLSGRPNKTGVYIRNGRKVIVK